MVKVLRRLIVVPLLVLLVGGRDATASSLTYLQLISDKFQKTVDVYTDADAAGNHFPARGEFDYLSANLVPAMDEVSANGPCLGITCITATFDPGRALWGGWYFMNGILGPSDRQPTPNWGTVSNAGFNLAGATALRFRARGKDGGENVLFFCCGVGFNPDTGAQVAPYPDSSQRVALGVQLTNAWAQYTIPLNGLDLRYTLGGFGWVASSTGNLANSRPITFYIDDIQYLKARTNDPRLLVSYETIKSTDPFDVVLRNAAYVYDDAVALIALIAAGDLARAQTIADALVYAQGHDRFFTDGRVRNAYQGSDISLPPGWLPNNLKDTVRMPGWYDSSHATWFEDETQVSTNTGNVAWVGLALLNMWEVTKNRSYLTAAEALGNWALLNADEKRDGAAGLLGGFTGGYDGWENGAVSGSAASCASGVFVNGQCKRLYKSTEHNIDLYSMFSRLYSADGSSQWADAARRAKHFFLSMWDPQGGKFWTGTTEDGVTVSAGVIPLDIQAWAIQALGTEAHAYLQGLSYVEAHHKTSLGYGFKQNGGNICGDNTWFEGTSQVAVAYLLSGNKTKWQSIVDGVHSVQTTNGGIPATDGACLNTGFTLNDGTPWEYFPRLHVGATAWLELAENGVNPYRAELYSPQLGTSTISFGDRYLYTGASNTVSFTNPGVGALTIQGVALTGANVSDFSQSNTCGESLPSGATCIITLSFVPGASGSRSATLTIIESSDTAMVPTMFSVDLTGNGVVRPGGGCTFGVNPSGQVFAAPGGTGSISITANSDCSWVISNLPSWVVNSGGTFGTGNGSVAYQVMPNAGADRSGSLTVAGLSFTIEQQSGVIPGLNFVGSMPHLAAEENWRTTFTFVNSGQASALARLSLFGDSGVALPLPLSFPQQTSSTGPLLGASLDRMLAPNASLVIQSSDSPTAPVQVGSARLASTGAVSGFAIFHLIPNAQEAVVPLETRNASSYLLAFDNTNGVALGVALANVSAQAANVPALIRDDTGAQIGIGTIALTGSGHSSFVLSDLFPVTANRRGTIEFDTPPGGQISALGIRFTPPGTLTTIPVIANIGTTGGSMAHLAVANGWKTTFVLVNAGTNAALAHLKFFDDNGNPQTLPLAFPQTGGSGASASTLDRTLAAGATLMIESTGPNTSPLLTGSAQMTTDGNVSGFVIFRYNPTGQEAVVPLENRNANAYLLAFDNTAGIVTGVAVSNASVQAATIPVVIRDDTGAQIGSESLPVAANGHSAFVMSSRFPVTANIRGTIEFDTPPGGQIGTLGIRTTPSLTFTTLPSLTKPQAASTINGRVVDTMGVPLSGVLIAMTGSHQANTTTAADGSFKFANVLRGDAYTITPSNRGYVFLPTHYSGTISSDVSFSFTGTNAGFTISGRVTDSSGVGISGVTLTVTGSHPATMTTPVDGSYSLIGFQTADTYAITPSRTGYLFGPNSASGTVTSSNVTISFIGSALPSAPIIISVTPTSGTTAGGTAVSIFGANFVSGAAVRFGTTRATVTQITPNQIQAKTPAGTGTVNVAVVNTDGQSGNLPNAFTYQGIMNPAIHAVVQSGKISGTVSGVSPPQSFKVVAYAQTNFYYIQPCVTEPLTEIASDGTWGPIDSHNGTIFALLVSSSYSPPSPTGSLPSVDGTNVLAITGPAGTISGYDITRCPAQ